MRSRRGDSPLAAISQGRISHLENGGIGDRISYYGRERPPKDSVSGVFSSAHGSSTRFPDDPMSRSADARIACRSPAAQAGKRRKAVARAAHVQVRFNRHANVRAGPTHGRTNRETHRAGPTHGHTNREARRAGPTHGTRTASRVMQARRTDRVERDAHAPTHDPRSTQIGTCTRFPKKK